jgi:signal transduction histidine kinase
MSGGTMTSGPGLPRSAPRSRLATGLAAWARGLALWVLSLVHAGLLLGLPFAVGGAVHAVFTSTKGFEWGFGLGLFLLVPPVTVILRPLANLTRTLADWWCGVPVAVPYRPLPGDRRKIGARSRLRWLLGDPATARDVLWVVVSTCVSWILPLAAWAAPQLLHQYGRLARSVLAPVGRGELALRVRHLAQTRADTIDAGAAELRRIELDRHDGAQARLAAMDMTLDTADQLLADNPGAARASSAEAGESSVRALSEIRGLIRDIHPPLLADRGLAEAVRALVLDMPVRAHFSSELTGRPPAPVESVAYFAVSELLANVSKHAHADTAWVDLRQESGMLRITVGDDGNGGAELARGTGLAGIERKLAAFDGVCAVSSPPDGPTMVTIEIPCALSSPRDTLSPRERDVLGLMAEGRSNAAIAQRLVITERAVAKHTASIFLRLGLHPSDDDNRRVLAVLAYLGR